MSNLPKFLPVIALLQALAYGADSCAAPPEAVAKVAAYLSYESRSGLWNPGQKAFSFVKVDGDAFFLQHEVPSHFDENQRWVYAFRTGSRLFVSGCPNNIQWETCAVRKFQQSVNQSVTAPERPNGSRCDLSMSVPPWHPSPDSPLKRRLGSEVLSELKEYGYENPREVYVRDFNVTDPELDFYIIDREGKENLQGCTFDADLDPHCAWHLYGMSPRDRVKAEIMADPYRLLPPPPPPRN